MGSKTRKPLHELTVEEKLKILTKEILFRKDLVKLFYCGYRQTSPIYQKIKQYEKENSIRDGGYGVLSDSCIAVYPIKFYDVLKLQKEKLEENEKLKIVREKERKEEIKVWKN